jgi:hypothetical protein
MAQNSTHFSSGFRFEHNFGRMDQVFGFVVTIGQQGFFIKEHSLIVEKRYEMMYIVLTDATVGHVSLEFGQ